MKLGLRELAAAVECNITIRDGIEWESPEVAELARRYSEASKQVRSAKNNLHAISDEICEAYFVEFGVPIAGHVSDEVAESAE